MAERVKGAPGEKKATEETGQKASELLLALLEELRASRAESQALRELLEKVFAAQQRQDSSRQEAFTEEEEVQDEVGQEGNARRSASRKTSPVAIQFVTTSTRKESLVGKGVQG